jgi:hypothetical protein
MQFAECTRTINVAIDDGAASRDANGNLIVRLDDGTFSGPLSDAVALVLLGRADMVRAL